MGTALHLSTTTVLSLFDFGMFMIGVLVVGPSSGVVRGSEGGRPGWAVWSSSGSSRGARDGRDLRSYYGIVADCQTSTGPTNPG
ncbi:hypothetical protein [Actinosynnema sp. NPDC023587]|uniref:hypothetical protein n=1 Tax=Actinosynnema sp. NPDC023587 TaxID=3154695 RepID=UPI0033C85416